MNSVFLIPLVALLIPIIVAPVAIGCKLAQRQRELEHAERMRALELGRVLPMDEEWWNPSRISVTLGAVVPILAIAIAAVASKELHDATAIQVISGLVGTCGVLSGGRLAASSMYYQDRARSQAIADANLRKPAYEPDAFDVVGRRG